jgi:signal peptidase I
MRRESPIIAGVLIAVLAALWILFAPAQFGGRTSYVVVNGISMEPKFHKGDLALVRKSDSYNVGDIVVYRHPTIGPIIHRIIGKDGDRYIFKGDNNDFVDTYHPTQDELIGKFWFHIPAIGQPFTKLRNRLVIAGLVALCGLIVLLPYALGSESKGRRARRSPGERRTPSMNTQNDSGQSILTILIAVALASLALAGLAFSRPLDRTVGATETYQQSGAFSYSATGPGSIYDSNAVTTGDPVFPSVTNNVDFRFEYHLTSDQPTSVSGTASFAAEVSDSTGWKKTIELLPSTPFNGNSFIALGTLDLSRVQGVINQFQQATGVVRQQYNVSIVPDIQIHGTLAGVTLKDAFDPRIEFQLDQHELQLAKTSSSSGANVDPLKPTQSGTVKLTKIKPNRMSLTKLSLPVEKARLLSILTLSLSLIGLGVCGWMTWRGSKSGEVARIQARFGSMMISVEDADFEYGGRVIDVESFDDLLRLAMRDERMIMHQHASGIHRYYVQDSIVVYRYRLMEQDERAGDQRRESRLATGELR